MSKGLKRNGQVVDVKALLLTEYGKLSVANVSIPLVGDDDVLVRVRRVRQRRARLRWNEWPAHSAARDGARGEAAGVVTLIGNLAPPVGLPLQEVVTRELSPLGSCASSGEYPECIDLLEESHLDSSLRYCM